MSTLVADTSGLVSLGILAENEQDPLTICLETYQVTVPEPVLEELEAMAVHEDVHGVGARTVLDRADAIRTRSVALDPSFPLDDGENAAVAVANEVGAAVFLCDEFNQLGLIHASLTDTRLVTTPTVLAVLVHNALLDGSEAEVLLERLIEVRGWEGNSYIERVRGRIDRD